METLRILRAYFIHVSSKNEQFVAARIVATFCTLLLSTFVISTAPTTCKEILYFSIARLRWSLVVSGEILNFSTKSFVSKTILTAVIKLRLLFLGPPEGEKNIFLWWKAMGEIEERLGKEKLC